jgi:hypothetical protein
MKKMFKYLSCCMAVLRIAVVSAVAQDKPAITDGPYVLYKQGQGYVKSIQLQGGVPVARTDSFKLDDKAKQIVQVHLNGHANWGFEVELKSEITPRQSVFGGAGKMLFLSDIEGEFEAFRNLLIANKVINEKYKWTFGKGKLIIAGDLFDRGKQVAQYLWLLYKLEDEARKKGGDVHVVLGNHDIMNLKGDFRYVQPEYIANAQLMHESYADLYSTNTELGRWLRSKNVIEKVGDQLVMHGGISREVLNKRFTLDRINNSCRPYYDVPTKLLPDSLKAFLGNTGLFWYRGYFMAPKASSSLIDSTLQQYQVKQIVVGHTITDKNLALYYNGKVLGLDVNQHAGTHAAALFDKGRWYLLDNSGKRRKLIYLTGNDVIGKDQVD